jgi:hypothetical protein
MPRQATLCRTVWWMGVMHPPRRTSGWTPPPPHRVAPIHHTLFIRPPPLQTEIANQMNINHPVTTWSFPTISCIYFFDFVVNHEDVQSPIDDAQRTQRGC